MYLEQIRQVVQVLAAAIKGLRLYPLDHPATAKQIELLPNSLLPLLRNKKTVKLGILEGTLFVEDYLFTQEFPAAQELARLLEAFDLVGLEFQAGLSAAEIEVLLELLHGGGVKGPTRPSRIDSLRMPARPYRAARCTRRLPAVGSRRLAAVRPPIAVKHGSGRATAGRASGISVICGGKRGANCPG